MHIKLEKLRTEAEGIYKELFPDSYAYIWYGRDPQTNTEVEFGEDAEKNINAVLANGAILITNPITEKDGRLSRDPFVFVPQLAELFEQTNEGQKEYALLCIMQGLLTVENFPQKYAHELRGFISRAMLWL